MSWRLEKYGNEVEIPRMKKLEKMKRLSYLIDICVNDKVIEIAESELGEFTFNPFIFETQLSEDGWVELKDNETPEEKRRNDKIIQRCKVLEKEYWNELISILKGPDYEEFNNSTKEWDEWFFKYSPAQEEENKSQKPVRSIRSSHPLRSNRLSRKPYEYNLYDKPRRNRTQRKRRPFSFRRFFSNRRSYKNMIL